MILISLEMILFFFSNVSGISSSERVAGRVLALSTHCSEAPGGSAPTHWNYYYGFVLVLEKRKFLKVFFENLLMQYASLEVRLSGCTTLYNHDAPPPSSLVEPTIICETASK